MKTRNLVSAIALVLCAGAALAMPPPMDPALFDTNGDGVVTRDEIAAVRSAEFTTGDGNGDGALSLTEFQTLEEANRTLRIETEFTALDSDNSGGISPAEFQNGQPQETTEVAARLFGHMDANGDGLIDLAEFTVLHSPEGRRLMHFVRIDSDGSGGVSQTEYLAPPAGGGRPGGPGMGGPGMGGMGRGGPGR